MIRAVLLFILAVVLYQAVRVLFRSALRASREPDGRRRLQGEEMVLDPECRTYVVRARAVTRRIGGETMHFCSSACADAHERRQRR